MSLNNLIDSQQLELDTIFSLFKEADRLRTSSGDPLKGKILATLFYEPSTRTRLSFEAAIRRLGGTVITTENAKEFSSATKGESIEDTIRVVSKYCDCIVIRHFQEGMAAKAATVSSVPIINAGDGKGQHPTQALLDLYTIYREAGGIEGTKIAMVGDLFSGRTVRSLCYLLGKFKGVEIIFVSPSHLRMKDDIKSYLEKHSISFREESDLNSILPEVDFVYMTRIQKERMPLEDYQEAKGKYVINKSNLPLLKQSARVLHPLPHVEEIDLPIETEYTNPKIAYFRQAENGLYIRMALLLYLLKLPSSSQRSL